MKRIKDKFQMKNRLIQVSILGLVCMTSLSYAAVALDRTRVIFNGSSQSVSLAITNKNKDLPYLAQAWMETSTFEKVSSPFVILPPLQRLEPAQSSQIRIEALEGPIKMLPQDRESLFYFNLREVPPASEKPNVLQIALQSKIKLFYRPESIILTPTEISNHPWQEQLLLIKQGDAIIARNPTAFYTTVLTVQASKDAEIISGMDAIMVAPFSEEKIPISAKVLGNSPVLTYINDYGGTPKLQFQCHIDTCQMVKTAMSDE